jgi:hypothetical protein
MSYWSALQTEYTTTAIKNNNNSMPSLEIAGTIEHMDIFST